MHWLRSLFLENPIDLCCHIHNVLIELRLLLTNLHSNTWLLFLWHELMLFILLPIRLWVIHCLLPLWLLLLATILELVIVLLSQREALLTFEHFVIWCLLWDSELCLHRILFFESPLHSSGTLSWEHERVSSCSVILLQLLHTVSISQSIESMLTATESGRDVCYHDSLTVPYEGIL